MSTLDNIFGLLFFGGGRRHSFELDVMSVKSTFMSEPTKQHYVPIKYLKRFTLNKSGDFYELTNLRSLYDSKVKPTNASKVCYEPNMYTLETEKVKLSNSINDSNIIEKKYFPYEKKELTYLFDKLEIKAQLKSKEIKRILHIIVDLKLRNIKILNEYESNENLEKSFIPLYDVIIEEMKKEGYTQIQIDDTINMKKEKNIENLKRKEYRRDIFRNNLLKNDPLTNEKFNDLIDYLYNWELNIYSTSPNNPFVTSDNPGYNLQYPDKFFNTNYYVVDEIVFPLSFSSIFCLKKKKKPNGIKSINYRKLGPNEVHNHNIRIMNNCNEKIFSGFKDQLEILKADMKHYT